MNYFAQLGFDAGAQSASTDSEQSGVESVQTPPKRTSATSQQSHPSHTRQDATEEPLLQNSDNDDGNAEATATPPFYPGTGWASRVGKGRGLGYNVNVPWPCTGMGDLEYLQVMESLVAPLCREFDPHMIVVSCGFDCSPRDPLGSMNVTTSGFHLLTKAVMALCSKVVVVVEGGYDVRAVALGSEAVLRALLGNDASDVCDSRMLWHQSQKTVNDILKYRKEQGVSSIAPAHAP